MMMEEKISSILMKVEPSGFTELLQGDRLKRYVVAFTNNIECTTYLLACQARFYWAVFNNLTIGWRTTPQGQIMIDIGTSTDDLREALELKRLYAQQAIRDTVLEEEIT